MHRVKDPTGLLYIKLFAVAAMLLSHFGYFVLVRAGVVMTNNFLYPFFEWGKYLGLWAMVLPAAAGSMMVARTRSPGGNRFRGPEFLRILSWALVVMALGYLLHFLSYWGRSQATAYVQNTLQFVAVALAVLALLGRLHAQALLLFAVAGLLFTAWFVDLRFSEAPWAKVLFAADGHQYIWPLFPWLSVFSFGCWLQWMQPLWMRLAINWKGFLVLLNVVSFIFLWHQFGWPIDLLPHNVWGEGVFQRGWPQGLQFIHLYFIGWVSSQYLCAHWPPRRLGVAHVFAQASLYLYVVHIFVFVRLSSSPWLVSHKKCLEQSSRERVDLCLGIHATLSLVVFLLLSWALAFVLVRYFMNIRVRIRLRATES
jgi:hypothetical protein